MNKICMAARGKRGFSLMEVLISFGILVSTGVLLSGFLYKGPVTQKARNENYGMELGKIYLLAETATGLAKDTAFVHNDAKGNHWEVAISQTVDGDEVCYRAQPVRNKVDSTRALYYCRYTASAKKQGGQDAQ